jgi:hypothetical protein
MTARTVTRSIEVSAAPDLVLGVLREATRIPEWAPTFADSIEPSGDGWMVTRNKTSFRIRVDVHPSTRCVDILREIAPGEEGGAYIRVLPRPGGGSVIVLTIPIIPTSNEERSAAIASDELSRIAALVAGR